MLINANKQPLKANGGSYQLASGPIIDFRQSNVRQMKMQELADRAGGIQQENGEVAQLEAKRMDVNGLTHLVRMENGGLHNIDFTRNEVMEVTENDSVVIDTDRVHLSRRGPNQEVNAAQHGQQGPQYYWYRVISVNGATVGTDVFIRRDALLESDDDRDNGAYELPYNFMMKNFGRISPSVPQDRTILNQLIRLKANYDRIPATRQYAVAKLKEADAISEMAAGLQSPELQEVAASLHRFPHVVLDHREAISLSDMVDIMNQIDDTRELGLLDMQHPQAVGRMGLMLGPKKSAISGAGASVSAPGRSRPGFGNVTNNFIAHTHPRRLGNQQAHTGELAKDIEGANGMEMVRAHSGETMFYDKQGPKNSKDIGRFADSVKKPTFTDSVIDRFTKLGSDEEYTGAVPSEHEKIAAKALATREAQMIWNDVQEAAQILRSGRLRREQYLHYLRVMQVNLDILENGQLTAITHFRQSFPTRLKPSEYGEFSLFS